MHASPRPARTARPRGRARATVLVAMLVAVGASGCSQLPFVGSASTQTLADGSGFLVAAPTNGGDDALVSGRLTLLGENCVGLGRPGGEETSVLEFPHGTRPSDDGRAIVLPDGLQVALGDSISAGGGSTTLRLYPDAFDRWPDAPSGCAGATYLTSIHDVKIGEQPQD